jgi:hypothetical protein
MVIKSGSNSKTEPHLFRGFSIAKRVAAKPLVHGKSEKNR